jgi:hypothetical protein
MPPTSTNAPKSVMFLTSPDRTCRSRWSLEQVLLFARALLFQQFAAADDHVAAALGQLDDLDVHLLADVALKIARRPPGQLARRHERVDADVHLQAALDAA